MKAIARLVAVLLVVGVSLSLAPAVEAGVVSPRLDRHLRLLKRTETDADAAVSSTVEHEVTSGGASESELHGSGSSFVETGDNIHEPRSVQVGTGALVATKEEAASALPPAVDVAKVDAASAVAAVSATATATATADDAKAKKKPVGTTELPAIAPASALVDKLKAKAKLAALGLDSLSITDAHDATITRSKFDRRRYRQLRLANGLTVLLVSDSKTSRAAVAMDIGQGHYGDPESAPGLAHFLEHMLFLGTKKYPKEDSYDTFLSQYGGTDNAYTDNENTNFYFDIQAGQLNGALDRFAQFFIAPLLSESATGRELNAVNAEHSKNKQNDEWRETQLLQSFAYDGHPVHKFGTGSLETLGKVSHTEMRALLFKFYQRWYHASNMRLVVLGKQKLSVLESWVRDMFAGVPKSPAGWKHFAFELSNTNPARYVPSHRSDQHAKVAAKIAADPRNSGVAIHTADPMGTPTAALDEFAGSDMSFQKIFDPKNLGSVVYFKSVKDRRKLSMYWPLPHSHYDEKSLDFIAGLLSNQHSGSLVSYLKHRGLILAMDAGVGIGTHEFDVIQITARLTEKGFTKPARIVSAIYGYLRLIREKAVEEWRYAEMKKLADIEFSMKSKERPIRYVSKLARDLREYRPRDILVGDFKYGHFNAAQIRALLNLIVPRNSLMMLSSGDMHRRIELTERERWYKTRYVQQTIPNKFLDSWTGALPKLVNGAAEAAATARFQSVAGAEESGVESDMPVSFDDTPAVHRMLDAAVIDSEDSDSEESSDCVGCAFTKGPLAVNTQTLSDEESELVSADVVGSSFVEVGAEADEESESDEESEDETESVDTSAADAKLQAELEAKLKAVDEQIAAAEAKQKSNDQLKADLMRRPKKAEKSATAEIDAQIAKVEAELKTLNADIARLRGDRKSIAAAAPAKKATDATKPPKAKKAKKAAVPAGPWTRTRPVVALNEKDLRSDLHEKLKLPPRNKFIPDDLTVHPVSVGLLPLSKTQVRPDPYKRKPKSKAVKVAKAKSVSRDPSARPKFEKSISPAASFLELSDFEHDPVPQSHTEAGSVSNQEVAVELERRKKLTAAKRRALLAKLRRRLVPIERNTDQKRNPIIIHEHDKPSSYRMWYHQDRVFKRPRVNLKCRLWSPLVYTNARTYTTAALWVLLLEDSLTEFSYQTGLAGFSYSLGAGVYGVDFGISGYGYNTGFKDYTETILKAVAKFDATPSAERIARFELVRTRLREQWKNARFQAPHAYSKYVAEFVLHQPRYFTNELAAELSVLTYADIAQWHQSLWTDVAAECLIHGNAAPRHAVTLTALIKDTLPYRTISQPFALQYRGLRLVDRRMTKLPGQFTVSTVLPNTKDKNSALYNYYQFGQGTAESSIFSNVLSMLAEKPAFHTLRTHEQLGYIVWALDDSRDGVQAFSIRIQSSTRNAQYLAKRVRNFLATISAMARDLSNKQWRTLLRTLIVHKMKPALTMDVKTRKFWAHISNQRYRFDYYLTQVMLIRRKLPRMKKYFSKYVDELLGFQQADKKKEADFRMLSVQVNPSGQFNKKTADNHCPKAGSNNIKVADLKKKIAAEEAAKKKKKKSTKAKAMRFAGAEAGAGIEADAEAEEAIEWAEDRESGELDSDTDSLTIDEEESVQMQSLLSAAESDSEESDAVDFESEVERLIDTDVADEEEATVPAVAVAVAAVLPKHATIAHPVSFLEIASGDAADTESEAEAEADAEPVVVVPTPAGSKPVPVSVPHVQPQSSDDVSQLPVAVTLRRRGKPARTVQILMEHLKTVSDELPLYPMRGVGALPPVFDPQAGAVLADKPKPTATPASPSPSPSPSGEPAAAPAPAAKKF